jgi:hypothetical protein
LWKYKSAKSQEYNEKKRFETIKGELYNEEQELNQLQELLQAQIFMDIDEKRERRKILMDSLYIEPEVMKRKTLQPQSVTNHIQIENNYGQAVANNQGIMNQTNNPEITELLKQLITKVLESDIPQNEKEEYIADLEVMKTESTKLIPNKKIFEFKLPTVEKLAAYATIASFAAQVLPVLTHFEPVAKL